MFVIILKSFMCMEGEIMDSETKEMLQAIIGRLDEQGAGIKGINERLDRVEGRLERVEGRLERIEESQERSEVVLEKLALRSIEQESRIDALKRVKQV
jgi:predicted nuclease with TOPRIM domain